jgi:hypothetical protein
MGSLRDAIADYDDLLLGRHLASTRELLLSSAIRHAAVQYGRPVCSSLRPHFISAEDHRRVVDASALLCRGIVAAAERLAREPPLRRAIGIPEYLEPLLELDGERGAFPLIGRFDGYLKDGDFSCFEFNTSPGSLTPIYELTAAFDAMPITAEFRARHPFRTAPVYDLAFDALCEDHRRRGGVGPPVIATVRYSAEVCPMPDFMRWIPYVAARGCRWVSALEEELVFENGRLSVEDIGIDVLVFSQWEDVSDLLEAAPAVAEAIRAGAVRPLTGLARGLLAKYKSTFELLTDPAHEATFEPEVAAALREHVPWTRSLGDRRTTSFDDRPVDLLPFALANREELVLKPSGALSGAGVVIGRSVDDAAWSRALEKGLATACVLQKRVACELQRFPVLRGEEVVFSEHHIDLDPHVWDARTCDGCYVRISHNEVTNVGAGGTVVPLWVLE